MPSIPSVDQITIEQLEAGPLDWLDQLPFGIIGLTAEGNVDVYNATEAKLCWLVDVAGHRAKLLFRGRGLHE